MSPHPHPDGERYRPSSVFHDTQNVRGVEPGWGIVRVVGRGRVSKSVGGERGRGRPEVQVDEGTLRHSTRKYLARSTVPESPEEWC